MFMRGGDVLMRKTLKAARVFAAVLLLALAANAARAQGEITVEGRLTRTTEAGGWLISADAGKYLILNARRFQSEAWFREGAVVVATGSVSTDTMTTYMEGLPFQVRTLRPRRGGAPNPNGDAAASDTDTGNNNNATGSGTSGNTTGAGGVGTQGTATRLVRGTTRVTVTGDATVQAQPDTAVVTVAVVTQNASASEAQSENASKTDAVVRAVKTAAGAGAEVKTAGYSLQPQYVYKEGVPPTITSYVARNAVTVTTAVLERVGAIIDAATRAGANNVDGLAFTLRRDETARAQALSAATREATAKARTVAEALGGRVVRVIEVQEGGAIVRPLVTNDSSNFIRARAAQDATPVEPGSLDIHVQVTLVAEVEPKP
jgi:uncharacterized protein YggE